MSPETHRRHEGHHHTANVKYGYIIFGLTLISATILSVSNYIWLARWLKRGAPNNRSIYARLGSPNPLWLHVVLWLVVTLGISFINDYNFKENYSILIKRFGRLGFYLVPFDILLAIRPSLLATSYLEYIAIHKWILRLILFMVSLHGVGYFIKWAITGNFWGKSLRILNLLGVISFFFGLALAVVSLRPIRRRMYKYFYLCHNITVASFMVLIFWHARPGVTDAILISVCMILFQTYQRVRHSYNAPNLEILEKENSSLRILRITKPQNYPSNWAPGAHIRLSFPLTNIKSWLFPSHPYTIFSLKNDSTLDLVVKKGYRFRVDGTRRYTISRSYTSLPPPFFQTAERVVILCGGSGISLGAPIFRYLKGNSSVFVELHWAISNKADTFVLGNLSQGDNVDVYVTQRSSVLSDDGENSAPHDALLCDGQQFELDSLNGNSELLSNEKKEAGVEKNIVYHTGRPVVEDIFTSLLVNDVLNNWVVACGPESMISSAAAWGQTHGVQVFLEFYDF